MLWPPYASMARALGATVRSSTGRKTLTLSASKRRSLALVSVAMGLVFISHSLLTLTVPLVGLRYGLSPVLVGVIVAVPAMTPLLLAIPLGNLVRRWSSRRVLMSAATAYAIGVSVPLVTPTVTGLIITQIIIGLAHVVLVIAAQSTVAELGEESGMEQAFGWYTTCLSVGQLLGPLVGGVLLDRTALWTSFAVAAALPLTAVSIAAFLPRNASTARVQRYGLGYPEQLTTLRTNVGVQMSLVVTIGVLFALGAHAAFVPLFLEAHGVPVVVIGALVSLRAFFSMVVRPFTPWVVKVAGGRSRTLLVAVVVVAAATAMVGLSASVLYVGILAALVGLGAGISQPLSMVAIADYVPPEARSPALGMRLMGNRGAQVASPLLLGSIVEATGFATAFVVAGIVLAVCAVAVVRLTPRFEELEAVRTASSSF